MACNRKKLSMEILSTILNVWFKEFGLHVMKNKMAKQAVARLFYDLEAYIKKQHLRVPDNELLDRLIENPDIGYLISTWLRADNSIQLEHLLIDLPDMLVKMNPQDQRTSLQEFFERAQLMRRLMPEPSNDDLALQSILGYVEEPRADGWSNLNRPLFALGDEAIDHLKNYTKYINHGIFAANTVLSMSPEQYAAFDARVGVITQENALYSEKSTENPEALVYKIFEDDLIAHLKKDKIISELLAGVKLFKPVSTPLKQAEPDSGVTLETLLGIGSADDDTDETLSDLSHESGAFSWRAHNIETYELGKLIELSEINESDVPDDRDLSEKERQIYKIMNALSSDLDLDTLSLSLLSEGHTSNESVSSSNQSSEYKKLSPKGTAHPVAPDTRKGIAPQKGGSKPNDPQLPFRAVVNPRSHNKLVQAHINTEKKIWQKKIGIPVDTREDMLDWCRGYKARRTVRASEERGNDINPADNKPPKL
jgi:hypothetical protein